MKTSLYFKSSRIKPERRFNSSIEVYRISIAPFFDVPLICTFAINFALIAFSKSAKKWSLEPCFLLTGCFLKFCISRSVSRTFNSFFKIIFNAAICSSAELQANKQRAWPAEIFFSTRAAFILAGNFNSRMVLVIVERSLPTRKDIAS